MACYTRMTGTGKQLTVSATPTKNGSITNSTKPLNVNGKLTKNGKNGKYEGVGYDSKGNPEYKYTGNGTKSYENAKNMTVSNDGINFIKKQEGFSPSLYDDAGHKAIGYGHDLTSSELASGTVNINGESINVSNGLTDEQATALLKQDVQTKYGSIVSNSVTSDITQSQYDALTSFAYNIGSNGFKNSTALTRLNSGDYTGTAEAMQWWNKSNGSVNKALVNRRQQEAKIFLANY